MNESLMIEHCKETKNLLLGVSGMYVKGVMKSNFKNLNK